MLLRNYRRTGVSLQGFKASLNDLISCKTYTLHVVDEFGDVSSRINSIKLTIKKVTFTSEELKRELAKREA